jgi:hypothetical protein
MSENHSQGRHQHSTTTGQITNRASGHSPLPSRHQDEDGSKANSQTRYQQVGREPNSRKKPGGPSCEAAATAGRRQRRNATPPLDLTLILATTAGREGQDEMHTTSTR